MRRKARFELRAIPRFGRSIRTVARKQLSIKGRPKLELDIFVDENEWACHGFMMRAKDNGHTTVQRACLKRACVLCTKLGSARLKWAVAYKKS